MKSSLIVSKQTSKYAYTHVRLTVAHGARRFMPQWRLSRNRSYSGERNVVSGAYEKLFIVYVSGRYDVRIRAVVPLHFVTVQRVPRPLYDWRWSGQHGANLHSKHSSTLEQNCFSDYHRNGKSLLHLMLKRKNETSGFFEREVSINISKLLADFGEILSMCQMPRK